VGASNVKAAYAQWGDLPHAPFRLLAYMALRSMDADSPPMFWGGREEQAYALGKAVPEGRDEESKRVRQASFDAVKDAMKVLKARGAVAQTNTACAGQRASFALNLRAQKVGGSETPAGEVKTPPERGSQTPPVEGSQTPEWGGLSLPPRSRGTSRGEQRISQSAHRRQAVRQVMATYGLNEDEAVIATRIAEARSPKPVDNLAAYIAGMEDGDMADIAAAVMDQGEREEPRVPVPRQAQDIADEVEPPARHIEPKEITQPPGVGDDVPRQPVDLDALRVRLAVAASNARAPRKH
jgi:hypothetical protein